VPVCDGGTGGLKIAGEDESYDFGSGAGFYVDATREPWSKGYRMYSYITEELPKALFAAFEQLDAERVSITGHSMGGHGALTLVGLVLLSSRSGLFVSDGGLGLGLGEVNWDWAFGL